MADAGPDYCYRCKAIECSCGHPVITSDGWIEFLEAQNEILRGLVEDDRSLSADVVIKRVLHG